MSILNKYKVYSTIKRGYVIVNAASQRQAVESVPGGKFARKVPTSPSKPDQGAGQPSPTDTSGIRPPSSGGTPSSIKPQITIGATADELAKAASKGCPTPIKVYKIKTKDGREIYVESINKKIARQKAEDAGYDVAWVTKVSMPGGKVPEKATLEGGLAPIMPTAGIEAGQINQETINQIRSGIGGNAYLLDVLNKAVEAKDITIYNNAVDEYNKVISDANWFNLYTTYKASSESEAFKGNWKWFQNTYADKLKDTKYMSYLESSEFRDKYASIIQPSAISDKDYNLIKPYITTEGFDSKAAFDASKDNPNLQVNIIRAANEFTLATLDDNSRAKIDSGEWTLLPYSQIIETKTLENMPPTYRNIVQNSGLVGYENYQEKVLESNKQEHWFKNTIDAVSANTMRLGWDIKNFALLELSAGMGEIKEGDPKPLVDPLSPMAVNVGYLGFTPPSNLTYTAEEAAEINAKRIEAQKYYKDMYDEAEMAAKEWMAQQPQLQPVYAEGFVDTVKKNPSALKDPLLWTETIANTLPYTVATGLIVGGAAAGGVGLAVTAPLAFGITMSVEGHDIYKDAIAHGASHDRALKLANIYGSISASIETLGDTIFVGALGIGGGAFASALGKNVSKNIVTGAAKKYGWKNLTAGMIKDFVNQGGQEFLQEVVHNAAIKTVDKNQAILENTANAFVSGVIGTAPFVLIPAGGQAIRNLETKISDVREGKGTALTPANITPQMQLKILNKVFEPVSGFTVESKQAILEHVGPRPPRMSVKTYLKQLYGRSARMEYKAGKGITVGLVDKKTVITGKEKVDEVALAYAGMVAKVNEYAHTELKYKQALKAISDFGMAKSKSELKKLNEYKEGARELEAKLKELKDPMVESVRKFSNVFLKNSVGLEAEQKAEVKEMPKTIAMDIDSVTTQLFGERTALEITKDIKELEGQIRVIEEEITKGMTLEQLEGYARLIATLKGQVGDLVNELRMRYLAEGEKIKPATKKLTMEVMSLQDRLVKAIETLQNFSGSALNYDVYRKGELATKGEVIKLERDTFESIQKTTEAIWGKESYAEILEKLNRALGDIISSMDSLKSKKAATKAAFKIYDAIKKQDPKLLKEGVKILQLEAGKIKDKPLMLAAANQVKLLDTLTTTNFWQKFQFAETKTSKPGETVWYKSDELISRQKDLIRQEAERNVALRLEKLTDRLPGYMQRWDPDAVMDYLRGKYDAQYFKDTYFGEFEDLDDFLDIDKEEARIRAEVERQERLQTLENKDIVEHEMERDLTKDRLDKTTSPKMKDYLDNHLREMDREISEKKKQLKTLTKTKVVIPMPKPIDVSKTQEGRGVAMVPVEKKEEKPSQAEEKLSEEEKAKLAKAKSKAKAAQRIHVAEQAISKEEEKATKEKEEKVSAFPGIRPKPKTAQRWVYADVEHALAQYGVLTGNRYKTYAKTAVQQAIEAGLQARAATQTRLATKAQTATQVQTQTQTAVQAAVKTALETQTETATKEETETATELITNIVTKTKTKTRTKTAITPFDRMMMGPPQLKQKRKRQGPPLAVWDQGMYYVTVFPPFRTKGSEPGKPGKPDVVYSREKPPWATKTVKGKRSPQRSLQTFGKVPELLEVPMGKVVARVHHGRRLTFSRRNGRRRGRVIER